MTTRSRTRRRQTPVEREAALMVVSASPEQVIRRLAALRHLGAFELRAKGVESIHDTYLDTPDGRLAAKRIALRTRMIKDGGSLITLKSSGHESGGVSSREELELPLNMKNAGRVLHELSRMVSADLPTPRAFIQAKWSSASSRLVSSQVRKTRRMIREVVHRKRVIGEMAVDRVIYGFDGLRVSLEEVEVEAKQRGTRRDVRDFVRELQRQFPDDLLPWPHSKLATGKALEASARAGRLRSLVTSRKRLKPAALPALKRQLQRES
ncbi:MAG TPA: CYTH domain-containing protein [Candidatus Eisenbacteria bacterium]|nr:CYTH domain-containing protein [Candidatus Eisenbacteria bacterium]